MVWAQTTRLVSWRLGPPLRVQTVECEQPKLLPAAGPPPRRPAAALAGRGMTVTLPASSTSVRPPGSGKPFCRCQAGEPLAAAPSVGGAVARAGAPTSMAATTTTAVEYSVLI